MPSMLASPAEIIQSISTQELSELPPPPAHRKPGMSLAALFLAVLFISLSAILVRLSEKEISFSATAFNRFWITALALGGWTGLQAFRDRRTSPYPPSLPHPSPPPSSFITFVQLTAAGGCLAADLILWAWSLTQTSVANATLLANLTPLFACLLGWLVWRKRFDLRFYLGTAIALGGAIALGLGDWQMGAFRLQGDIAALLAAFSFSLYLLLLEQLQTKLHPNRIVLWSSALAALLTFPLVLTSQIPFLPHSWQGWLTIIALALVCQVLGQGLLIYCLNRLSAEFVAIVMLLDPLLAMVGAWMLFAERPSVLEWMAIAVILLGIYYASTSHSALKTAAPH